MNKKNYKFLKIYRHYWFFIWFFIYFILYYLLDVFTNLLELNNFFKIIFIGGLISIIARVIHSNIRNYTFKLNFNLFIWTLVYILLIIGLNYLISFIESTNLFLGLIIISLGLTIFIDIIKKRFSFKFLSFISIVLIIVLFLFNISVYQEFTNNNSDMNTNFWNKWGSKDISVGDGSKLNSIIIKTCTDGTKYNKCSKTKPYYCKDGNLIEYPEKCLCDSEEIYDNNKCLNKYQTGEKEITLEYVLRGNKNTIDFTVYKGMNNYLAGLDRTVWYNSYELPPTDEEMELTFVNQEDQIELIKPLVDKIKNITSKEDDQARIAISIVQNLPYDWDSVTYSSDNRYAYETLYDMTGVCADKTRLLAVLLKELGYGVVIFNYSKENHEAIGIKCPKEYAYVNEYCFIETTNPSIITDNGGDYIGVGKLTSTPKLYLVSSGKSFDSVKEEYDDKVLYNKLIAKGDILNQSDYAKWEKIVNKYGFKFD